MNTRTQIYLDDKQRRALKMLAASRDLTVSDLVRRAVDRLLCDEFGDKNWETEMEAAVTRIRAGGSELSDDQVDAAIAQRRARRRQKKAVA
jgi:Arc/MetJ-type ribon-helix-helix transcriptional regulator